MPIVDDVRIVLNRLASRGWKQLFNLHGLRLDAPDLAAELVRPLAWISTPYKSPNTGPVFNRSYALMRSL